MPPITKGLKALLQHYGALNVTLHGLISERPGTEHESLDEYYKALGNPFPDEPVLVVRISEDGEPRFLKEDQHNTKFGDDSGKKVGAVTVLELPEDEFWYFQAFRPGLFNLDIDLPQFMYDMCIIHAFAMFEGYLSELLRECLRQHPHLMGGQRQLDYGDILSASSKEMIVEIMIEREVRELMYLPLQGLLERMRERLGFRSLTKEHDQAAYEISLIRNCLLHNQRKVDTKLAKFSDKRGVGDVLVCTVLDVDAAIRTLRKLAYQIDMTFESNDPTCV